MQQITFIPGAERGPFSYLLAELSAGTTKKPRVAAFRRLAKSLTELKLVRGEHTKISYIGVACNSAGDIGLLVIQEPATTESRLGVEDA